MSALQEDLGSADQEDDSDGDLSPLQPNMNRPSIAYDFSEEDDEDEDLTKNEGNQTTQLQ